MKVRNEILAGLALLVGLPLLGVRLAGEPIGRYLEFPPTTQYVEHAPFSWWVFIGMAVVLAGLVGAWCMVQRFRGSAVQGLGEGEGSRFRGSAVQRLGGRGPEAESGTGGRKCSSPCLSRFHRDPHGRVPEGAAGDSGYYNYGSTAFPWWGWCGVVGGVGAWVLAWTRFSWFKDFQMFTFSPQWLAYVVVVNALTYGRSGKCLLTDRPRHLAGLFVLSAGFWWFFEYLNRFVQNWHYVGIGTLTAWEYFVFATLPFSTVLPAVMSTHEWLATFPRLTAGLDGMRPWRRPVYPRRVACVALVLAAAGLAGIGLRPDILFPLLWISPVVIIASLQTLAGRETVFGDVARGDWSRLVRLALAALVCGFFWELWNDHSLAKWIYTVPYVNRFKVFEMPILGYAGYLPFGWECAVIAGMLEQWERRGRGTGGGLRR